LNGRTAIEALIDALTEKQFVHKNVKQCNRRRQNTAIVSGIFPFDVILCSSYPSDQSKN